MRRIASHSKSIYVGGIFSLPNMGISAGIYTCTRTGIIIIKWCIDAYINKYHLILSLIPKSIFFYKLITYHFSFHTYTYVTCHINDLVSFLLYFNRDFPRYFFFPISFYLSCISQSPSIILLDPPILTSVSSYQPVHLLWVIRNT